MGSRRPTHPGREHVSGRPRRPPVRFDGTRDPGGRRACVRPAQVQTDRLDQAGRVDGVERCHSGCRYGCRFDRSSQRAACAVSRRGERACEFADAERWIDVGRRGAGARPATRARKSVAQSGAAVHARFPPRRGVRRRGRREQQTLGRDGGLEPRRRRLLTHWQLRGNVALSRPPPRRAARQSRRRGWRCRRRSIGRRSHS